MKRKVIYSVVAMTLVFVMLAIPALALTRLSYSKTCPKCGNHTGTYIKVTDGNKSVYHRTICSGCGLNYYQSHYWSGNSCSKCNYPN